MKKLLGFALLGIAAVGASLTSIRSAKTAEIHEAKAEALVEKYIDVNTENFDHDLISGGNATFWNEGYFYGTNRPFINTFLREGDTFEIRSRKWVQSGEYVSFLIGGGPHYGGTDENVDSSKGAPANFVNIWSETKGVNVGENICNSGFKDPTISCNMIFRYVFIPEEYRGDEFLAYIRDNSSSRFGGVTFGELKVNQTWDEVVASFSNHLATYQFSCNNTPNTNQYKAIKDFYATNDYYADLRTALAAKESADDDFEDNDALSKWAIDRLNTVDVNGNLITIDHNRIVNNAETKGDEYFKVPMPMNKTGDYFVNADTSGIAEPSKYRLVSSSFKLSGVGLISAKMGGGTAVLSLLDDDGNELASTRTAAAEGTNYLNPAFVNGSQEDSFNIMQSGIRLNTMTRVYLDCHEHLGKTVRVAISDGRTGGEWGLAYFDDVVTKYDEYPAIQAEQITQKDGETTYYGVVTDKYMGSQETTFGKAWKYVNDYYNLMRAKSNRVSWCDIKDSAEVTSLLSSYEGFDPSIKAIIDASMDYSHGKDATAEDFYLHAIETTTIGASINYIKELKSSGESNSVLSIAGVRNGDLMPFYVTLVSTLALAFLCLGIYLAKKKKANR